MRMSGGGEEEKDIKLDLISEDRMASMTSMEKIRFILDGVKLGNIVVLEGGLTPEEQMKLIEMTMSEIDEDFAGIEIGSYPVKRGFLGLRRRTRLTIVGPANMMKTIKKDKDLIRAIISRV
ncbi:MAG: DUF2073 family protein [Candidatus Alkanophagales archaeon MCA70_species_1]|nr:DUF2073 family protein [Candidatus Alkanophaga volatiphilum]